MATFGTAFMWGLGISLGGGIGVVLTVIALGGIKGIIEGLAD